MGRNGPITVAAILKRNAFRTTVVAPTDSVAVVVRRLCEDRSEAALILDRAGQLIGIIDQREIVAGLASNGSHMLEMTAGQLMTRPVRSVTPRMSLADATRVMLGGRLRHVPVIDEAGSLVGVIGLADLMRTSFAREQGAIAA